jgi:hypothetical protein
MGYTNEKNILTTSDSKISKNYTFDVVSKVVTISDFDFKEFLYIVNINTNTPIYNATDEFLTGMVQGNSIALDTDLTGMANGDKLLILYNSLDTSEETETLLDILDEIKKTNKILAKIYK